MLHTSAETFIPLSQKSYHGHVDKISSSENFTENSMVNLSPIANNLLTPVLPTFSDDCTNTSTAIDLEFNYSNVENLPDPITILNEIRTKFVKNVLIGHLNINALANKFDALNFIIRDKLDILVLCETKLDTTFPERQFLLTGFKKTYRLDRNKHGGGVMIYVRDDIPSVELKKHTFSKKIEAIFVEINLRKNKFLLVGTYHSTHPDYGLNDSDYFEQIEFALDTNSSYDK